MFTNRQIAATSHMLYRSTRLPDPRTLSTRVNAPESFSFSDLHSNLISVSKSGEEPYCENHRHFGDMRNIHAYMQERSRTDVGLLLGGEPGAPPTLALVTG